VLGVGADEAVVEQGVNDVSGSIESKFQGREQKLVPKTLAGSKLFTALDTTIDRALDELIYLSAGEIGAVAHLPNENVDSSLVAWQREPMGNQIPSDAERFGELESEAPLFPANRKPRTIPPDTDRFNTTARAEATAPAPNTTHDTPAVSSSDNQQNTGNTTPDAVASDTGEADSQERPDEVVSHREKYPDWLHKAISESNGENVGYCDNQTRWVSAREYALGAVIGGGGGVVGAMIMLAAVLGVADTPGGVPAGVALVVSVGVAVLGVGIAAYERARRLNEWHVVTDGAVYVKTGILGRRIQKIRRTKIHEHEFDQTIVERLLGTGTVTVGSASTGDREVEFSWVKNPGEMRDVVEALTGTERVREGEES
jgi:membrane protein YdbS with pleckstrin-like domain